MRKLVYDIGLHRGEDSEFYLRKGFQVVGVDADEAMCQAATERLQSYVTSGQLQIVNVAIADKAGDVTFYKNANPQWGTLVPAWRDQNDALGSPSAEVTVRAITLAELIRRYGAPFFMKIDIEGMDRRALQSLHQAVFLPTFISIESAFPRDPSIRSIRAELDALARLGYDRFKIVPQACVEHQTPPCPALVGEYVPFQFEPGSSGLFGHEAPGDWLTLAEASHAFGSIVRRSWLAAQLHRMMSLYLLYCGLIRRLTGRDPEIGWFDIHAQRSGSAKPAS